MKSFAPKPWFAPQPVLIIGTYNKEGVAIAILYADNQVANNRHARAIAKELLVCRLCIILLCLYELMVEINIIHLTLFQLARCKHTIEQ